jgi:hypothetical protein
VTALAKTAARAVKLPSLQTEEKIAMSFHRRLLIAITFFAACALAPALGHAEDSDEPAPAAPSEPVCGRDLMTPEEAAEHRAKMWSAKTPEERDAYRAQHHAAMMERAKERGVTLDPGGCPRGGMMGRGGPPTTPPAPQAP